MIGPLQSFAHDDSPYERPNQKWLCGRLAEGRPCHVGPDRRGRCRARAECAPRSEAGRWLCTRPASLGGPCAEGALPGGGCARPILRCQPVRSARARRGQAVRWAAMLAVGLLVLALGGAEREAWLSPGELSLAHGDVEDCGQCHRSFAAGPAGWLAAAFSGLPAADAGDSARCLDCHRLGDAPLSAHSAPADRLAAMREHAAAEAGGGGAPHLALAAALLASPERTSGGVACANCHREHRGRTAELTELANARCQACHVRKFASLSRGHPPFEGYPNRRRTRIDFDHAAHFEKHFPETAAKGAAVPATCAACHVGDGRGAEVLVAGFETSCAACHAGEIRGESAAGAAGIPVIVLPGLDVASLRRRGTQIGAWPELSDRKLTPFMAALFAAEPTLGDALQRFQALDPLDLERAADADLEAVAAIAWASKQLLYDLAADGPAALRDRLAAAFGQTPDGAALRELAGGLAPETVRRAAREWWPALADEIARHRAGTPVPIPPPAEAPARSDAAPTPAPNPDRSDLLSSASSGQSDLLSGTSSDLLSGDRPAGGDLLSAASSGETEPAPAAPAMPETAPEDWSRLGGWYLDFYALWYRPADHADRFLRRWLVLSGGAAQNEAARALFDSLARKDAPGKCGKCHSVDAGADGVLTVNWLGRQSEPRHRRFSHFPHAPHFVVLRGGRGCATCHRLDPEAAYAQAFQGRDPARFAANFKPIGRELCADCHVEEAAGDACTMCHDYHVATSATVMPATRLKDLAQGAK